MLPRRRHSWIWVLEKDGWSLRSTPKGVAQGWRIKCSSNAKPKLDSASIFLQFIFQPMWWLRTPPCNTWVHLQGANLSRFDRKSIYILVHIHCVNYALWATINNVIMCIMYNTVYELFIEFISFWCLHFIQEQRQELLFCIVLLLLGNEVEVSGLAKVLGCEVTSCCRNKQGDISLESDVILL